MGTIVTPAAPLKFDGATARHTLPPRLGQHTTEVLEQAGFTASDVQRLLECGAAQQSTHPETTE